ncbi:MAG: hypothetical protein AAFQ07_00975 [Chloroflexota bacterium]
MSGDFAIFDTIRTQMVDRHVHVSTGKMMRSEAITYKDKVFAFYGRAEMMCFKLGRDFDHEAHGITDYTVLAPFKSRPPMKDWFLVPDSTQWERLSQLALDAMREALG